MSKDILKVRKNKFGEASTKTINPRKQKQLRKEDLRSLLGNTKDFQEDLEDYYDDDYKDRN